MNARPMQAGVLFFLGSLLIQVAWVMTLPPFRGIDEFDHAYRAAAVARGEWDPPLVPARHGRGWLLVVPESLVRAATPVCSAYTYTGPDNCRPVRHLGQGQVTVASAAANYNPVFYWFVGYPAKFFQGAASLLVMRLIGSLICSMFVGLAGWILASWASTRWPLAALALALSPMVVYSTALGAPNGVEMLGGAVLWAALLGLDRTKDPRLRRRLVYAAVAGAVPLVSVRSLGPLWLALDVLAVVAILGLPRCVTIVAKQKYAFATATLVVALAGAAGIWWTLSTGTNAPEGHGSASLNTLSFNLELVPVWILQSVAAFPTRTERAPVVVYACVLLTLVAFFALCCRAADRRLRLVLVGTIAMSVAVSSIISYATMDTWGTVWQGRYALPYTVGVPLGASLALDRARFRSSLTPAMLAAGYAMLAVAQAVGLGGVLIHERSWDPLAGTTEWHTPRLWLVLALPAVGMLCWALAARFGSPVPRRAHQPGRLFTSPRSELASPEVPAPD